MIWSGTGFVVGHGGRPILRLGDRHLDAGQGIVLQGGNGSGKSTLLATIAGSLPALAGRQQRQGTISWMPQVGGLSPHLPTTLGELVALAGGDTAQALARVGLGTRAHQRWSASSGGERQRALLARALAPRPQGILLDEPDSHLDAEGRDLLVRALEDQRRGGGSWLAVLHQELPVAVTGRWLCRDGEVTDDHR
jgi:ABC-type Mn2+/Zn2+ transport system ATPase subunit